MSRFEGYKASIFTCLICGAQIAIGAIDKHDMYHGKESQEVKRKERERWKGFQQTQTKEGFPHHGEKWRHDEIERLGREFVEDQDINRLSNLHGRTPGGITAQLVKMGLIDQDNQIET